MIDIMKARQNVDSIIINGQRYEIRSDSEGRRAAWQCQGSVSVLISEPSASFKECIEAITSDAQFKLFI